MSISLYDLTVPVFLRGFANMSAFLQKGRLFAESGGMAPETLLQARLFPDMAPLTAQIQRASDTAKGAVVRLGEIANTPFADTETTFDQLQARIAATVAFLNGAPAAAFDGREGAPITLSTPGGDLHFTGKTYALNFALPNFFFHVTTAYALLRHHGAPVGKLDFLGGR